MVFIQFTASGAGFAVQEFLSENSLHGASLWLKGDARRSGKVHDDSGFGFSLPDAETTVAAPSLVEAFLESNGSLLSALQHLGIACNLHLGVTVGEQSSFAPTLEFAPAFLDRLAQRNISLSITGYPTSDEE